jgi:HEPN domain-containing protein
MSPKQRDASDPREWLRRARANLARARTDPTVPEPVYEDFCFDAQQAAEKAIKAVLIARSVPFPKTHVIVELLTLAADAGLAVPPEVRQGAKLTRYALLTRYPGMAEDVTAEEHAEAVHIAERVLSWAEGVVATPHGRGESE